MCSLELLDGNYFPAAMSIMYYCVSDKKLIGHTQFLNQ